MLFMVIEHFRDGDPRPVYHRFRELGRQLTPGVEYVMSWVTDDLSTCYQVMECDDRASLEAWIAQWTDVADFEVIPVITSAEASARVPVSGTLPTVELRPITDENRAAVLALRTSEAQQQFVSTVADSLEELADEPGGRGIPWAVYADGTPVGFVMVSDEVDGPEYIAQFLWKLLIDERQQRKGYGTATLDRVVEYLQRPGVETIWTSAGRGEGSPIPFYERYGFVQTGEIVFGGEMLLRLDLPDL